MPGDLVQLVSVSRRRGPSMARVPRPVVHTLRFLVFVPLFLFGLNAALTAAYFGGGGGPMYVRARKGLGSAPRRPGCARSG